jgi:intracellular multiplication protein IcmL
MAENDLVLIELQDAFYRDSMPKVVLIIISLLVAIFFLAATSLYLYLKKPIPLTFGVWSEWRVQPDIPLVEPHRSTPEVVQWSADTLRKLFVFDFVHYNDQLDALKPYFTDDGWRIFLNQVSNIANHDDVTNNKVFVNGVPSGAPVILNQGLLSGRYAWWVQIPIDIAFVKAGLGSSRTLTLQVLLVRVPTLNNLAGIAIDNIVIAKGAV